MHIWGKINEEVLREHGVTTDIDQFSRSIAGKQMSEIAVYTIETFNLTVKPSVLMDLWKSKAKEAYKNCQFINSAAEFIKKLHLSNKKVGIATASPLDLIESFFESHSHIR